MADLPPSGLPAAAGASSTSLQALSADHDTQLPATSSDPAPVPQAPSSSSDVAAEHTTPSSTSDDAPLVPDIPAPVAEGAAEVLQPPTPAFMGRPLSTTNQSFDSTHNPADQSNRHTLVGDAEASSLKEAIHSDGDDDPAIAGQPADRDRSKRRRLLFAAFGLLFIVVVAIAVAVPLATRHHSSSSSSDQPVTSGGGSSGDGGNGGEPSGGSNTTSTVPITGGNGTKITTETGDTFIYINNFAGFWYDDPNDPYNNNAQAQSWTPPLSQPWDWKNDALRGVNLGGWLVPEPFIVPSLFEPYANLSSPATDEYTLSQHLAADTANGGLSQLEKHYQTFITEEDFAKIAAAGLNWVRLPIPFWAVQTYADEPYLEGVAWKYALKAFKWARKYGLRVNLDLHAVPGSQNGFNHSGKGGNINFLNGVMGIANAQRTLDYLRVIVEFISQPEYANVVPMLGVVNEPRASAIGIDALTSFYLLLHDTVRNITGYGEGHGPYLSVHDGFAGLAQWADLLPGNDRMALDVHPYFVFSGSVNTAPLSQQVQDPCEFQDDINNSLSQFGVTTAGEWSLAINDCGLWLNGVNSHSNYESAVGAGSCDDWNNYANWTDSRKQDFQKLAFSWMDALQHWFFWTWKIGPSSVTGQIETPQWSYSLGLENGWISPDPRGSAGACPGSKAGTLKATATGSTADAISDSVRAANAWPPTINGAGGSLPSYTATGPIPTLPAPTGLTGWFDQADTRPIYTPIAGCTYPDEYDPGDDAPSRCTGSDARRRDVPLPRRTASP